MNQNRWYIIVQAPNNGETIAIHDLQLHQSTFIESMVRLVAVDGTEIRHGLEGGGESHQVLHGNPPHDRN